jgi:ABC-type multidrug transport system fused ATPase/permease subunit
MVSAERYYRLFDTVSDKNKQDSQSNDKVIVDKVDILSTIESIAFDNVCFSYKSTGTQVLKDISFTLGRGKVVALLGSNGAGKSTVASILAGLYKPTGGRISMSDGTDVTTLDKTSKKRLVQVILQSTALLNMSILENVRYSQPQATEQEVVNALQQANCNNLISKLQGGLDYVVGLNGCKLSGGERQRLALARALLSDPICLVMDEPNSSLDAEGESAVVDALTACRAGKGRSLLLITHQAKSLRLADEILVMQGGMIVERGTFDDLKGNPKSLLCKLMPDIV